MVKHKKLNQSILIILVLAISLLFIAMISQFLLPIFLAGLFSALLQPVYQYVKRKVKGKENFASIIVVISSVLLILIPFGVIASLVVSEAIHIGENISPWVEDFVKKPGIAEEYLSQLPFYETLLPYRDDLIEKSGALVGAVSGFFVQSLSSFSRGTVNVLIDIVILLYVMFYFLSMGSKFLHKILYYLPLAHEDEAKLLDRFTSVTKATLKSTLIIGVMQGGVCGLAFLIVGINGVFFWASIMVFLSIIPAVGTALVWLPAAIVLALQGSIWQSIVLLVICGGIAGNLDNILRPKLVGKDTQLHDLFVLFGTLGGISLFGLSGIIIGPIIAALFVSIWEIYGEVFKQYLPDVKF